MTVGSVERPEKQSYPQPHITGSTRRGGRRNLGVFINIGGIFMNTTACFAHTDMNDPFSRHLIRLNQAEVDFWLSVEPDKFRDFHTQIDEIATRMSLSRREVKENLRVGEMLRRFPRLRACVEKHHHITMSRLKAIERQVMAIEPKYIARVDAHLADYFTPKVKNQVIPQVATLSKQLRDYITTIDPSAAKKPQDQQKRSATFKRNLNGHTRLSIHITDAEAVEIRTLMKKQHEDEPVDAFMKLIRSKARTKVVLNTFKTGTGHLYMVGAGTIPEESITIDSQRTIDLNDHTHSYAPTEEIRAAVMLLDRHCRYPGCTVDALECDLDHVINHDEGGETSIANLACLCRFHHNIKTEQRIHYSLDANRIATFHFRNGATKTTQPGGIKVKHRFSQTWQRHEQQRIRTRRNQSA